MSDAATTPTALVDRAEIHDVVLRYARGLDRRDWPLVASCFTPDAACDYGDFYQGPLPGLLDAFRVTMPRFDWTMHVMGNHYVDLAGDRAETETYAVCHHQRGDESIVVGMRYLDVFLRMPDGWRIAERRAPFIWQRRDRVAPAS